MLKKVKYGLLLIVVASLVIVAVVFMGGRSLPPQHLPSPNGFDTFVQAAGIRISTPDGTNSPTRLELAARVATNGEALKLVRAGLRQDCLVEIHYTTNEWVHHGITYLANLKHLATDLRDEATLAEMEGRTNDAARISVEIIRFGILNARGGLLMNQLVGIACRAIGVVSFRRVIRSLDAATCQELIRQLADLPQFYEAPAEVARRDRIWSRRVDGLMLMERIKFAIQARSLEAAVNPDKDVIARVEIKEMRTRLDTLQLEVELAARAYELEHGAPPTNMAALVPGYLKELPTDPATHTNLTLPRLY